MNDHGTVAFLGWQPSSADDCILTQHGLVACENGFLADGTEVMNIDVEAGHPINNNGTVAFQGFAVPPGGGIAIGSMTQNGVVIELGQVLGDGTTVGPVPAGGLTALNDAGQVAMVAETAPDTIAVMTLSGVQAEEGTPLPDGTVIIGAGDSTDGIALLGSELTTNTLGDLAFHAVRDDMALSVMSNSGKIVATGDTLGDGTTVVNNIVPTRLALADDGTATFFALVAGSGDPHIITQHGVLAGPGSTLGDGSVVSDMATLLAGFDSNDTGNLAFVGRVAGFPGLDAVLSETGIVAMEGDMIGGYQLDSIIVALENPMAINAAGDIAFFAEMADPNNPDDTFEAVLFARDETLYRSFIPEPGTVSLLALGLLALRRRRARAGLP
jgi:hypothetical protein